MAYANWPKGMPNFMGGAGGGANPNEEMEDVLGDVGGGQEEED